MSASKTPCSNCYDMGHDAKDCAEDNEALRQLDHVAAFIGARLNYVLPECNSGVRGGKPVSTIRVDQHKEKFWFVRIYCTLADPTLVEQSWKQEHSDAATALPLAEFRAKCLKRDAAHYRMCYLQMVDLLPKMKRRIRNQADHCALLLDDAQELDKYLESLRESGFKDPFHGMRHNLGIETDEELLKYLGDFYAWVARR